MLQSFDGAIIYCRASTARLYPVPIGSCFYVFFPYTAGMNLKNTPDTTLLRVIKNLVQEEREILSQVLWHLREIDRRKLYADQKCSSLFDYCVKVLKYSEGQASRRVNACRLLKEIPEIMPMIEAGELNLTQLNQANSLFKDEEIKKPEEKKKILDEIAGATTRGTDKILDDHRKNDRPKKITLHLKEETVSTLKEVHHLKAHKFKDIDEAIMAMAALAKREWDPGVVKRQSAVTESTTRFIPKQVKAFVWNRDQGKCQNCSSTRALEYDHIKPFSQGGKTTVENLRLLCRNCNQRKGIVDFKLIFESGRKYQR